MWLCGSYRKEPKSALCRPFAAETWHFWRCQCHEMAAKDSRVVKCSKPESMTRCMCCEQAFGTQKILSESQALDTKLLILLGFGFT